MENILIIKHIPIEGPGRIKRILNQRKISCHIIELSQEDKLSPSPKAFEAIILLGGPMNVYEEEKYPFLNEVNSFIQVAFNENIPLLGICLGAQLIAKAAGAKVYRAENKEIGWSKVTLTPAGISDPLFKNFPDNFPVFQWHGDTFDIPEQGELLGFSDSCKNQVFRYGYATYGLQFHMEITAEMIKDWMLFYDDELKGLVKAGIVDRHDIVQNTYKKLDSYYECSDTLFSNYFHLLNKKSEM